MGILFRRKKRDKRKQKQKKQNVNSLDSTQGALNATTAASAAASVTTLRASNVLPSASTHTPTQTSSPPQSPLRPAASSTTVTAKSTPVARTTKNKPDRGFGSYTLSSTVSNSSLSSYSSSVAVQQNDTNISTSSTTQLESNHYNGVGMQDVDDNGNNALNEETSFSKSPLDDNNKDDEKKQQQHPHPQLVQVVNLERSDIDNLSQRDGNQKKQNGVDNDQVTNNVGLSMNAWVSDMNTLVSSNVFQNATISTMTLASTIFQSMLRITFYPLVKPIQISSSILYSTITFMKYSTFALTKSLFVHTPNNSNLNLNLNSNLDSNSNLSSNNTLHSKNVVDHGDDTVETKESSNSLVHNLIDCSLSFFFGANAIRGGGIDETNRSDEKPMNGNNNHDYEKESIRYFNSENMEGKEEEDEYIPLVYEGEEKDENVVNLNQQHSTISSSSSSSSVGASLTTNAISMRGIISKTADDNNNEEHKNETIQEQEQPKHLSSKQNHQSISSPSFYIRTGDLNVYHHDPTATTKHDSNEDGTNSSSFHIDTSIEMRKVPATATSTLPNNKLLFLELQLSHAICTSMAAASARMNIIQTMEEMVLMGIKLIVTNPQAKGKGPNHKLVSWKEEGSTSKLLKRVRASLQDNEKWYSNPKTIKMLEKETLTWSGYVQKDRSSTESQTFAPKIPIFKGRGVISGMNPQQLTELFLDSKRVKSYNKWSNGRKDLAVFQDDLDMVGGKYGDGCLKVVQSETSIPLSNSKLKMTNFLHARSIKLDYHELFDGDKNDTHDGTNGGKHNAYIIASRTAFNQEDVSEDMISDDKDIKPGSQNEIIWGLNILLEIPGHPDKTDLTTFNQANSSAVPSFLVNKIGLTCAGDFFKNIRGMKSI